MNPNRHFCFLLILFTSLRLAAQADGVFRTERLGTKDGLSHRWALCVHQDTKGFIWVGTYDGLNRYDGKDFIAYRPSANGKMPVTADFIYQVAEMADGKFHLSSQYGILCFDPETAAFSLLRKEKDNNATIVLNPGRGLPFLEYNIADFGNPGISLNIYKLLPSGMLSLLATSPPSQLPGSGLIPVLCDEDAAWFWDFKGVYYRFDLKKEVWGSFLVKGSSDVPVDAMGNLWLPDGAKLRSFPLPKNRKSSQWNSFNIDAEKTVWLYAKGEADVFTLFKFDMNNGSLKTAIPALDEEEFTNYRFVQLYRPSHYLDVEGTVWFAGFLGLYKVRRTGNLFRHYLSKPVVRIEAPPSGISTRQMVEDAVGNIYLRTTNGPTNFFKINPETGVVQSINLPKVEARNDATYRALQKRADVVDNQSSLNMVTSIIADKEGIIWLANYLGLFRYEPQTGQFRHFYFPSIYTPFIFNDGKDRIWWIAAGETYLFDKVSGQFQREGKWNFNDVQHPVMLPDENTLWGFTDTGLVKVNTQNLDTRYIRLYNEPREQRCLVSHKGWLWVGTSRGLEKVNPKTFAHTLFDRSKGLPGNFIYCMVADGDYLWLGTSDGLCRFHVETGAVKNFYVEDGLSHNEFNTLSAFKARDGRIYMGGLNGINAFFSDDLEGKTTLKSQILLSRFSLFNSEEDSLIFINPANLINGIELSPSVTSFNLHLALNSFIDPAKNQYAWRMEGLDEDWYYAGNQHMAAYRHVPPGRYTFRAKAADSFGNWSENELSLSITVLRPWYSRWWAWLSYLLVAGAAVFALYRNQLSKKMEHAENLRLQELDGFKNRFFTNITHEFRTPLTVILGMVEQLEREGATSGHTSSNTVTLIKRNGQNLLRLINQILDLAKLESNTLRINYVQGDVLPYLRYITESLQSFANAQNVLLRVESSEAEILMDYDPERLLQIVYNLLSNAIKFTPGGGRVALQAGLTLSDLSLIVTDNGAGIPREDLPHIFDRFYQANNLEKAKTGGTGIGLSLTRELVKAMGGDISVESEVGKGTTFTILLPISNRGEMRAGSSEESGAGKIEKPKIAHTSTERPSLPDTSLPSLLVIEDNPDVVEYLIACLGENYRLDYAYNGRSGIEKALETVPDLIVSDVMMPEKDGFEVCNFLKNDERTSHIPIVLLTAKADVESRIAGLRRGADAYLAKPFHQEELLVTLQNLLQLRRQLQAKYLEILMGNRLLVDDSHEPPVPNLQSRVTDPENEFLKKLRTVIAENLSNASLDVDMLCRKTGMGRTNLHNKLSALTGLSTTLYVRKLRLNKAIELLRSTEMNIAEIAYEVGFNDPKFFSRVFAEEFGAPPSEMRKKRQ